MVERVGEIFPFLLGDLCGGRIILVFGRRAISGSVDVLCAGDSEELVREETGNAVLRKWKRLKKFRGPDPRRPHDKTVRDSRAVVEQYGSFLDFLHRGVGPDVDLSSGHREAP